jgi:hypothetical protein
MFITDIMRFTSETLVNNEIMVYSPKTISLEFEFEFELDIHVDQDSRGIVIKVEVPSLVTE